MQEAFGPNGQFAPGSITPPRVDKVKRREAGADPADALGHFSGRGFRHRDAGKVRRDQHVLQPQKT